GRSQRATGRQFCGNRISATTEPRMKITVRFMAQAKQAAGVASEMIEAPWPCSAAELVRLLVDRHGAALRGLLLGSGDQLQSTILMFVNDEQVFSGDRVELQPGDDVTFLSPIAGGSAQTVCNLPQED